MLKKLINQLRNDPLFRNSVLLMASTGLMALLGFVFWSICAKFYTETQVGVATALLAVLNLVTSLSLLGFEISIIRVLATHKNRSDLLNSTLTITGLLGIVFGGAFLLLQPILSPELGIIHASPLVIALFMVFIFVSIASYMLESVLIALRNSQYVLQKGLIFSFAKLIFPIGLVGLGAFGIYASWMIALAIATLVSAVVLWRKFDFRFKFHLSVKPLKGMITYSLANYASSFAEGLPIMLLPLIILSLFGPIASAHYYIAMMLASLLFVVPVAATQSQFAEGSHADGDIKADTLKALKIIFAILVPGIIGLSLLGPFLLGLFGESYAADSVGLLALLAISGIPVALNSIARTVLKLRYQSWPLVWVSLVGSLIIVALCFPFKSMGLTGVGLAWLIGQIAMVGLYAVTIDETRVLPRRKRLQAS